MATTVHLTIPGGTTELYEALNREMGIDESHPPDGLHLHIAAKTDDGIQITDVWESREQFDRFVEDDVMPAMAKLGGDDAPPVEPTYGELIGEFSGVRTTT
jgi:hypothetical protein